MQFYVVPGAGFFRFDTPKSCLVSIFWDDFRIPGIGFGRRTFWEAPFGCWAEVWGGCGKFSCPPVTGCHSLKTLEWSK